MGKNCVGNVYFSKVSKISNIAFKEINNVHCPIIQLFTSFVQVYLVKVFRTSRKYNK